MFKHARTNLETVLRKPDVLAGFETKSIFGYTTYLDILIMDLFGIVDVLDAKKSCARYHTNKSRPDGKVVQKAKACLSAEFHLPADDGSLQLVKLY